mmetsp:Transcript_33351/g.95967  ORF Transcript_33351/g.95967 Transcript_33351/m.95967 type:complete len:216 (+) Transcript_33351:96-743(+)
MIPLRRLIDGLVGIGGTSAWSLDGESAQSECELKDGSTIASRRFAGRRLPQPEALEGRDVIGRASDIPEILDTEVPWVVNTGRWKPGVEGGVAPPAEAKAAATKRGLEVGDSGRIPRCSMAKIITEGLLRALGTKTGAIGGSVSSTAGNPGRSGADVDSTPGRRLLSAAARGSISGMADHAAGAKRPLSCSARSCASKRRALQSASAPSTACLKE